MAEEFEAAGIYGGNWWNMNTCSSRSVFPLITSSSSSSSLCSIAANQDGGNFSCAWQTDNLADLKSPLVSHHHHHDSLGFLVQQKQNHQNESSPSASENNGNILLDSSLGFSNWNNHSLLGRPESNFESVLEEEGGVDSSNSEMKTMNQEFAIDHRQQNLTSASYGYGLCDEHNPLHHFQPQPQPEGSLFTNPSLAYSHSSANQASPSWSKASDHFFKPSMPKQQLGGFHFSNDNDNNNSPFWNNSPADHRALDAVPGPQVIFASSPQSQTFEHKPSCSTLLTKHKREEASVGEPAAFKRPRIETPSPLPTFKVRKEKLGDRITALQQLVSPFGKTDTASVLHEAIEYIKYLHDQVSVLSAPYLNNNGPAAQHYQGCEEKESKEGKQDLRSQGLCLAPISSTFSLANYEMMASELWTHAYGGAFIIR